MFRRLGNIKAEVWFSVGLIVMVASLTFLPLIGQLGYYHDDWFTTISRVSGVSLLMMHTVDRPWMGGLYMITANILGESPLAWHLFYWTVRLTGGLVLLWLLRMLWPQQKTAATFMVLIYIVYPGFMQHPSANNYQNHMLAYSGSILSLALTVWAVKTSHIRIKVLASLAALVTAFFYPRVYEAMIGMEGLRLIILFFVLYRTISGDIKNALKKSFLWFIPYFINGMVFVYWRLFIFTSARVTVDAAALLAGYRANPLGMGLSTLVTLVQDVVDTLLAAWLVPLYQLSLNAPYQHYFLALAFAAIGLGSVVMISGYVSKAQAQEPAGQPWVNDALWIGAAGLIITLVPVALSGREVQFRIYLDRYTYQSIVPVAILLVGVIFKSIRSEYRSWAMGGLVFLAVSMHILNAAQYSQNWSMQKKVWWELSWRAPQITPGTLLVVHMPPGYRYPEGAEIWAIANRIYYPDIKGPILTAEVLDHETILTILAGKPVDRNYRRIPLVQDFSKVLILSLPSENSCLQVINGDQELFSPWVDELTRQAAPVSDPDRIMLDKESAIPPQIIFGREPDHGWCYYYQRAALAKQKGDWEQVRQLGAQAEKLGLRPGDPVEILPFLEAKLQSNDNLQASDSNIEILEQFPGFAEDFCQYYQKDRTDRVAQRISTLYCPP